jgi:holo-[acyl-carrier-protein] synthase
LFSVGTDLVEIDRIRKSIQNPRFRERVFGETESARLALRGFPVESAAASFCAKEAFAKAIGTGLRGFRLREVELLHDEKTGRPKLALSGNALRLAGNRRFSVSVTHTAQYASAVVVCEEYGDAPLRECEGLSILRSMLKPRAPESNKGDYGRLLCVCGSEGMAGAAAMSVGAALRCGAGIVEAALPRSIYPIVASRLAEPVFTLLHPLPDGTAPQEDVLALSQALKRADAVLIGCGLGKSPAARAEMEQVLRESSVPVVLDADGINLAAEHIDILRECKAPLILTPHPGEMARLLKTTPREVQACREETARNFSAAYGVILVLKGAGTLVASPDGRLYRNSTGNPGMARGGSGDVLAGMIASFAAQGIEPYRAAAGAVYLHGLAGDRCAAEYSQSAMLPTDLIGTLPALFRQLGR